MPRLAPPLPPRRNHQPFAGMCSVASCQARAAELAQMRLGAQLRAVPVCALHAARLSAR